MPKPIITIDGPAGAGKSTIAQRLAQALGFLNLESGAMYRALALKALDRSVPLDSEADLVRLASSSSIRLDPGPNGNLVWLDGSEVSARIRGSDVTEAASRVSVHPQVREWMVARQRELGADGGVVMEGRDIGTKVFPNAELKIFLVATPELRARRRILQGGGDPADEALAAAMSREVRERDDRDRTRSASPLVPASDAITIDSSALDIQAVVDRILGLIPGQG